MEKIDVFENVDQLFVAKFLSQTKKLAESGKSIKIFSRQENLNKTFNYSCHLCGVIELGNETDLHLHVKSSMHQELMKLPVIPLRSWMFSVIIDEEEQQNKSQACALGCGDCSVLKSMLEKMCGMKKDSSVPGVSSLCAQNTNQVHQRHQKRHSKEDEESGKPKKHRSRSPSSRKSRSKSRKSLDHRHRSRSPKSRRSKPEKNSSQQHRKRSPKSPLAPEIKQKRKKLEVSDDPAPNFLSICRYLVTLEDHISKYSKQIKSFFVSSLDLERQQIGSSNRLLTRENLEVLKHLKHHLKDQIVLGLLPLRMLGVARSFVNEFERLLKDQKEVSKRKSKMTCDLELIELSKAVEEDLSSDS